MTAENQAPSGAGLWRQRARRWTAGINVGAAVALALAVFALVNLLAQRHLDWRRDIGGRGYYRLSDKTRSLLRSVSGSWRVTVLLQRSHPRYADVRNLLREYSYAAERNPALRWEVEWVDPDRDLARARELEQRGDLAEPNLVLFEYEGRRKSVAADQLADYEISLQNNAAVKRLAGFKGEQAFSSAIQSLTQSATPTVYFLMGHGEHDLDDSSPHAGYARAARALRGDNIDARPLLLAQHQHVPTNCSALIVAGPTRALAQAEVDAVADYLNRNGRALFLLDAGVNSGLEPLLERWGVRLGRDVVVGMSLTGRELVVANYGQHPVTRGLQKVITMFYAPRSVNPLWGPEQADGTGKPLVSILALNTRAGWAESDLAQHPPRFDSETDVRGPVPIAAAVERGPASELHVEVKPTRLVVIGDSTFLSNAALAAGVGGNLDLFLSAVNWLLEREALLAIAPKPPGELRLDLNRRQLAAVSLTLIGAAPAAAAVLGFLVWLARRR